MPELLVSVRSAEEARQAWGAGAAVIDVKEPARGPLGAADPAVWLAVRQALPSEAPVSVSLGEILDHDPAAVRTEQHWQGIRWCKVGFAALRHDFTYSLRLSRLQAHAPKEVGWIVVIYLDDEVACSPQIGTLVSLADKMHCAGVVFDTWDKRWPSPLEATPNWIEAVRKIRSMGLLVTIAGGLDEQAIARLRPLEPDYFAVRGAACVDGHRENPIDAQRVARLAAAAEREKK